MQILATRVRDAMLIEVEPDTSARSFFTRSLRRQELAAHGLITEYVRSSYAFHAQAGALFGLHYQPSSAQGAQLINCVRGRIYAVVADVRADSPTYLDWDGFEVSDTNGRIVYAPDGVAKGYLTLTDDCEVIRQLSQPPLPDALAGLRYDDPALAISWPTAVSAMSRQDESWPLLASPRPAQRLGMDNADIRAA